MLPDVLGPAAADGRVVVAHLGSGASMCAMRGRKSVATTMGFTALDGLPMGRRCGNLDPGVVLYLMQEKGMTAAEVSDLLYQQSACSAFPASATTCETLLASDRSARERGGRAVRLPYRARAGLAGRRLGGLDALVFTAGIGEHAPEIRRRVCEDAAWLGVDLDDAANTAGGPRITTADSRPPPG